MTLSSHELEILRKLDHKKRVESFAPADWQQKKQLHYLILTILQLKLV